MHLDVQVLKKRVHAKWLVAIQFLSDQYHGSSCGLVNILKPGITGHNHFGSLSFGPFNHGDQQPRLRATWEGEGYMLSERRALPQSQNTTSCTKGLWLWNSVQMNLLLEF